MPITRRTDYAVRLMYELAQLPPGATLSMRDLCEAADVPMSFGASLVEFLVRAALVRADGYNDHLLSLARSAGEITMAEVVRASEPDFSLSQCTREPDRCARSRHCGAHVMWVGLDRLVWERLESITLGEVAADTPMVAARGQDRRSPDRPGVVGTA